MEMIEVISKPAVKKAFKLVDLEEAAILFLSMGRTVKMDSDSLYVDGATNQMGSAWIRPGQWVVLSGSSVWFMDEKAFLGGHVPAECFREPVKPLGEGS